MAHHSSTPMGEDHPLREFMRRGQNAQRAVDEFTKLGATGRFPEGKLADDDEGEIQIAVGQKDGKIVLDFGKPVAWVGLTAEQAEDFGRLLQEHGREARLRRG